jgi:hypothetical protein
VGGWKADDYLLLSVWYQNSIYQGTFNIRRAVIYKIKIIIIIVIYIVVCRFWYVNCYLESVHIMFFERSFYTFYMRLSSNNSLAVLPLHLAINYGKLKWNLFKLQLVEMFQWERLPECVDAERAPFSGVEKRRT